MKKHAIIPIFISHRGCPNQCVFCNQRAITARSGDVTPEDARKTIEEWLSTLEGSGIETELSFFGGSFTGIPMEEQTAFLQLAKEYKDAGRIAKIHCSTRPDYISREILDNLKHYGMDVIELGVQSFDPAVLEACRRGHSAEDVDRACSLIKEYGFTLGIQLMIDLPGDSRESCMASVRRTIEIGPQIARLYPTVVLQNTPLAGMLAEGSYVPKPREEVLSIVTDMYRKLTDAGIQVIRIGLKSNELIQGETYHPAFGQLVKSRAARAELDGLLQKIRAGEAGFAARQTGSGASYIPVTVAAPSELLNFAVGHGAENKKYFAEKYPHLRIRYAADENENRICVRPGR